MDTAHALQSRTAPSDGGRWFILDLFKALACLIIILHHLSAYSPMFDRVMLLAPDPLAMLYNHGRLAVQAFLVVGGYLSAGQWLKMVGPNAVGLPPGFSAWALIRKRFLRLSIPLMAALALTVLVTACVRPWYPHSSLSAAPGLWSLLVHVAMLQDLWGVPALSAGIWYVAIDFQLYLIALLSVMVAAGLQAWQPRVKLRGAMVSLWVVLTALSLDWWNRQVNMDVQGLYFFGSYGLGMLACRVRMSRLTVKGWAVMFVLGLMGLWLEPRLRMGLAWAMALFLAVWPASEPAVQLQSAWRRAVQTVAQQSYSIFLIHFVVILLVSAIWFHAAWQDPWVNLAGLCLTVALSLWAGSLLYRTVESPAATGWRWLAWVAVFALSGGVATTLA